MMERINTTEQKEKKMIFSLYFHNDNDFSWSEDGYKFILDMSRYADENHYDSIWVPERHFDEFGASYPNPCVLLAAISSVTQNINLNCGGLIMPLHDPMKIAEDYAMLDILSKQRAGIAFTSGWHVNDYVLNADNFEKKNEVLREYIETFNHVWKKNACQRVNGNKDMVDIMVYPQPKRADIPQWLTTVMEDKIAWKEAGKKGMNIFTELLVQKRPYLERGIKEYRESLKENGFDPASRRVTLMLHTFIGNEGEDVRKIVEEPFKDFLMNHLKFFYKYAKANKSNLGFDPDVLSDNDIRTLVEMGIKKYFQGQALIGDINQVKENVDYFRNIGVDELACLIDFGVDKHKIKENIGNLTKLKEKYEV